jgi:uncharacterized coiled-coil DUF342 family protein
MIAVITAAIAAIKGLNKIYNKNEEAAKKAEKASIALSKAYDEAKVKHEEFKNTLSNYETAKKGIDSLT